MGLAAFGQGVTGYLLKDIDRRKEEETRTKIRAEEFDFFEKKERMLMALQEEADKRKVVRTEMTKGKDGRWVVQKFNAFDEVIGEREANELDVKSLELRQKKEEADAAKATFEANNLSAREKRAAAESAAAVAANQANVSESAARRALLAEQTKLAGWKANNPLLATAAGRGAGIKPGDARASAESFASLFEASDTQMTGVAGELLLNAGVPEQEVDKLAQRSAHVAQSLKIHGSANPEEAQQAAMILDSALRQGPDAYKQVLAELEKSLGGK